MTSIPEYFDVIFPDQQYRARSGLENQRKLQQFPRTKLKPEKIRKNKQKLTGEIKTDEKE